MIKFPFTPAGVTTMCQHFYEQPHKNLQIEAGKMSSDFSRWLQMNFELSEAQLAYVKGIEPEARAFIGANAAFALANRLPIILAKPDTPNSQESKLTKPKSKLAATILPNGSYKAEGEFVIEITY